MRIGRHHQQRQRGEVRESIQLRCVLRKGRVSNFDFGSLKKFDSSEGDFSWASLTKWDRAYRIKRTKDWQVSKKKKKYKWD